MRRAHHKLEANGVRFFFLYDREQPDTFHITARHGTAPLQAIETFFGGEATWNEERQRFETVNGTRGIYWIRLPDDEGVLIISCFPQGDD